MKKTISMLLIGFATTLARSLLQAIIPIGKEQTVLEPSIFATGGTLPIAFMIYGSFAYATIAFIYLVLDQKLSGTKRQKGLKYALCCSLIWIVYLLEPLPHVAMLDKITYPLADSIALVVMGLLLGKFVATEKSESKQRKRSYKTIATFSICFFLGRLIQYRGFKIYSSFETEPIHSILWAALTGVAIGFVYESLKTAPDTHSRLSDAFVFGFVIFGLNLVVFNFFMPLVFAVDFFDLILRTAMDILAVTIAASFVTRSKAAKREASASI